MPPICPIESLESRRLLTDLSIDPTGNAGATVIEGTLYVNGGSGADVIRITSTNAGANISVSLSNDHTDVNAASGLFVFPAGDATKLVVKGKNGADTIDVEIDLPATLNGGAGSDILRAGDGDSVLYTESGAKDRAFGGAGDDTIYGGGGRLNRLSGNAGDDTIFGHGGSDIIHGGDGSDEIRGDAGNDSLFGEAGNDRLYGGGGDDHLDGGADGDRLYGNKGDDKLTGSTGADLLDGGSGSDDASRKTKRDLYKNIEWMPVLVP